MKLTAYQSIEDGQLKHRGHSYEDLAQTYGTPLYVFDETSFVDRIQAYQEAVKHLELEVQILYASKALLTLAVAKLVAETGIGQDVVSAGEIYTGIQAGVDPSHMYFHGNNKLDSELVYALDQGVGTIVLDNPQEAQRLNDLLFASGRTQRVMIRMNPGIDASTHDYIMTANDNSKFGINIHDDQIATTLTTIKDLPHLDLVGFHSHIGSQIFEESSFLQAAKTMLDFAKEMEDRIGLQVTEMNLGGGFGVYYTQEDQPFEITDFLPDYIDQVYRYSLELGLNLKRLTLEPGRSLVNESGSTLYRIGDTKTTLGGVNYLFVDGGMNDNIRPALYQAEYEACLPAKINEPSAKAYTIAGKACESGDIVIEDLDLPEGQPGDLLLVNRTGAYNYSMASNYNMIPRPAMVHINDQGHRLTVAADSFADLTRNQSL